MLQYRQNSPQLPMDIQPSLRVGNEDPLGQVDTLKIVSCPTCRAVYIPSSQQQAAVPGSLELLEAAFLSLCRSCFRCQRSSCPQCWNPMHHTCAACCEEALLPFCSPVPSLEGLVFSSRPSSQTAQAPATSFTCLRNGRFYTPAETPHRESLEQNPVSLPASSSQHTSAELPVVQIKPNTPDLTFSPPSWIQEITGRQSGAQAEGLPSLASGQWKNNSSTRPAQTRSTVVLAQPGPQVAHALPQMPALPAPYTSEYVSGKQQLDDLLEDDEDISLFERIENVLIVVISVLLLTIVLMVVLAISSPTMNTFFFHLLHIDIRAEILYLLQVK